MGFVQPGVRRRRRKPGGNSRLGQQPQSQSKSSKRQKLTHTANSEEKSRKSTYRFPLSPLERLPTELLQTIFVLSQNPSLPLTSPALCQVLTGRYLQAQVLRSASSLATPTFLNNILSRRFFNVELLQYTEDKYGPLIFHGIHIPSRLLKAPFVADKICLLNELLSRGITIDQMDIETNLEAIKQAVEMKNVDFVELLTSKLGIKPFSGLLSFAIEIQFPVDYLRMVIGPGDLEGVRAWLIAMEVKESEYRVRVLNKLLELGNPPPEIMGQICIYL